MNKAPEIARCSPSRYRLRAGETSEGERVVLSLPPRVVTPTEVAVFTWATGEHKMEDDPRDDGLAIEGQPTIAFPLIQKIGEAAD